MDAEQLLCTYLHKRLRAPVYYDVPEARPNEFVIVEQTGGHTNSFGIGKRSILVQCWSQDRKQATSLGSEAKTAVRNFTECENITAARISSEYRDRDIDSGTPRFCLLIEIDINE